MVVVWPCKPRINCYEVLEAKLPKNDISTFLLATRRLSGLGEAPEMDPAVMEEMLASASSDVRVEAHRIRPPRSQEDTEKTEIAPGILSNVGLRGQIRLYGAPGTGLIGVWNRLQEAELLVTAGQYGYFGYIGFSPIDHHTCCQVQVRAKVPPGAVIALRMIRRGHNFRVTVSFDDRVVIEKDVTNGGMWPRANITESEILLSFTKPFAFVSERDELVNEGDDLATFVDKLERGNAVGPMTPPTGGALGSRMIWTRHVTMKRSRPSSATQRHLFFAMRGMGPKARVVFRCRRCKLYIFFLLYES